MKFLLVEDDEHKRVRIVSWLEATQADAVVDTALSFQSGLRLLLDNDYNLVLFDMSMPTFDIGPKEKGGRTLHFGGRELIRQMARRSIFVPVVVVTGLDRFGEGDQALTLPELDTQLKSSHPEIYLGSVYYHVGVEGWKEALLHLISRV